MMLPFLMSALDQELMDFVIQCINVAIRCSLIAMLLYEINGMRVNRPRTAGYAVLVMLSVCLPMLPFFEIVPTAGLAPGSAPATVLYILVQIRNPLWMLLCYFLSVAILKLPWQRVTNLLVVIFCAYQLQVCLAALISMIFSVVLLALNMSPDTNIFNNFILAGTRAFEEVAASITTLVLVLVFYLIRRYIRGNRGNVKLFAEEPQPHPVKAGVANFAQITVLWLVLAAGMLAGNMDDRFSLIVQGGYVLAMLLLYVLCIYLNYNLKLRKLQAQILAQSNKMMQETIGDFQGIKHDFNNILQTYDGYFELGDMERLKEYHQVLRGKTLAAGERLSFQAAFNEKPAILGLFANAMEYAREWGVRFEFAHAEILNHVHMREFDLCRMLGILLNNAIEHAARTKDRVVSFLVQAPSEGRCSITITNSADEKINPADIFADGYTTKHGHSGHGLAEVNKILAEYYGCSILPYSTDDTFIMYVSLPLESLRGRVGE